MVRKRKFVEAEWVFNLGGRKGSGKEKIVKWIKIRLDDLYSSGHLDMTDVPTILPMILKDLLKIHNAKYELLMYYSPDTGTVYYTNDEKFIRAIEKARMSPEFPLEAEEVAVLEYAAERGASAVVELVKGYEWALALVFEKR